MKNPINKLELALTEMKFSWYKKLEKKLSLIESGELSFGEYQKEVIDKVSKLKAEVDVETDKDVTIKALTIKQPWAGLLVLGIKKNETRGWRTNFRGKLAIHSSKDIDQAGLRVLQHLVDHLPDFSPGSFNYKTCTVTGSLLGTVEMTDCISTNSQHPVTAFEAYLGNYDEDRYFWTMRNPDVFPNPIPIKGKLNLWNWNPDRG